jgi:poly-gamma-glutamate synthesis protein (capsule biosynthesis protein)
MRFAFVGDVALGDHPKTVGFGFRSRYPNGIPGELAVRVRPPGPRPDFLFGNLEFALGLGAGASNLAQLQCRGLDEYVGFLTGAGISALNVATNHSTQAGVAAWEATVRLLRASGIHVVGTPADFTEQGVVRVGDQRVALLGWSDRPRQYANDVPPYNEFSDAAYHEIEKARKRADIVIASMHWGDEFILVPGERERTIARAMVDAGATFVIGHHPHVIREVERHDNGVIAYSLGNFICDMTWDARTRFTGWLTSEIEDRHVVSSEFIPGVIENDYFPRALSGTEANRRLAWLSKGARTDAARAATAGYARAAEEQRKRHAARTALMMLRNFHRYRSGVAVEAFRGALSHRIRELFPA